MPPCIDGMMNPLAGHTQDTDPVVQVRVHDVAGKEIQLELASHCTVADLKDEVASHWQVPPACQKLVIGTGGETLVLMNEMELTWLHTSNGPVSLSMFLSLKISSD